MAPPTDSPSGRKRKRTSDKEDVEDIVETVNALPENHELRIAFKTQVAEEDWSTATDILKNMTALVKQTPEADRQTVLVKLQVYLLQVGNVAGIDLHQVMTSIDEDDGVSEDDEEEEADGIIIGARSRRRANTTGGETSTEEAEKPIELKEPKIGLDTDLDKESLITEMTAFRDALVGEVIPYKKDGKWTELTMTTERSTALANFFFTEFVGLNAIRRLKSLISSYQNEQKGASYAVSVNARKAARAPGCPSVERVLFDAIADVAEGKEKADEYQRFKRRCNANALSVAYQHYFEQARQAPVTSILHRRMNAHKKPGSGVGRGLATRVLDYLASKCGTNCATIRTMIYSVSLINVLVDSFGVGVLLVLPAEIDKNILDYGTQVISAIIPRFKQSVPAALRYFEYLKVAVYDPVVDGEVELLPDPAAFDLSNKDTFYDKIKKACPSTPRIEEALADLDLDSGSESE